MPQESARPLPGLDPGALAMQSTVELGEAGTLATAQLLNGLSGMLVSASLTELLRDLLGTAQPQPGTTAEPRASGGGSKPAPSEEEPKPEAAQEGAKPEAAARPAAGTGAELAGAGASILREMVVQGMVGRILALNTANTYLSLATAEQLRQWGSQIANPALQTASPPPTAPVLPATPTPTPAVHVPPQASHSSPACFSQPVPTYWGQPPMAYRYPLPAAWPGQGAW